MTTKQMKVSGELVIPQQKPEHRGMIPLDELHKAFAEWNERYNSYPSFIRYHEIDDPV